MPARIESSPMVNSSTLTLELVTRSMEGAASSAVILYSPGPPLVVLPRPLPVPLPLFPSLLTPHG